MNNKLIYDLVNLQNGYISFSKFIELHGNIACTQFLNLKGE